MLTVVDGAAVPKVNLLSTTPISFSNLGGTIGQIMLSGYLVDRSAAGSCATVMR